MLVQIIPDVVININNDSYKASRFVVINIYKKLRIQNNNACDDYKYHVLYDGTSLIVINSCPSFTFRVDDIETDVHELESFAVCSHDGKISMQLRCTNNKIFELGILNAGHVETDNYEGVVYVNYNC